MMFIPYLSALDSFPILSINKKQILKFPKMMAELIFLLVALSIFTLYFFEAVLLGALKFKIVTSSC